MNKIVINYTLCTPPPRNGYKIYYRVSGTADAYALAGTFFSSPAVFYDNVNPAGTCYEGFIVSSCSDDFMGNHIPFETCGSGAGGDNSSCGTFMGETTELMTYYDYGTFDLHVDGAITVHLLWSTYDRPNRFTVYEDGAVLITTGYKGYAPYPGPWGGTLSTTESGDLSFTPVPGRVYQIQIEAGPAGPPPFDLSDNWSLNINCDL